jgi:K+-transporting ATPase c subunit
MNPPNSSLKKAEEQFQSAARESRAAMEPHLDKMETDEGKFYLAHISTVSIAVCKGAESSATLDSAIEMAAAKTGIPKIALEAHARLSSAMINVMEIRHQTEARV